MTETTVLTAEGRLDFLKRVPFFTGPLYGQGLDIKLTPVAEAATVEDFEADSTIVTFGEAGNCLFVIVAGEAYIDGVPDAADLSTYAVFGDLDLLARGRMKLRTATVRSRTSLRVLRVEYSSLAHVWQELVYEVGERALSLIRAQNVALGYLSTQVDRLQAQVSEAEGATTG